MGGSAVLIKGTVAEHLLAPRPLPRTWVDRALLRTRTAAPRESGTAVWRCVEVDAPELSALLRRFHGWLAPQLAAAGDPGARQMQSYLETVPGNTFLRGDAKGGGPLDWCVQISFSGCAGMAQTSAELAAHWVRLWLARELPEQTRLVLLPLGFTPHPGGLPPADLSERFIATALGHARLPPETSEDDLDESGPVEQGPRRLEFDDSLLESAGEGLLKEQAQREPQWIRALQQGCCCLLCAGGAQRS